MSQVLVVANTTALGLGYVVLILMLSGAAWFVGVRLDAWRYNRRRKRQHDIEWDNLRSAWIFDERRRAQIFEYIEADRRDTDVLDITVEQIYDYQKEHGR